MPFEYRSHFFLESGDVFVGRRWRPVPITNGNRPDTKMQITPRTLSRNRIRDANYIIDILTHVRDNATAILNTLATSPRIPLRDEWSDTTAYGALESIEGN